MTENRSDICLGQCFHPEIVERVSGSMASEEDLLAVAELFKALGDGTRMSILGALLRSELCVCDLTLILKMNQSAVSQQLRVLRGAKIVKSRKEGKNVYYSLDDRHISMLMETGFEHVREERKP
ncbi:MAG: metalloregulator ArsR/SmtB family transcription factor [Candidatus Chlorobium antarcticum]|jgi:ArsR family transcriptional regulator|nr:metalloregulator ArsR/SmtB family transcription factor [Candidatus Chlorobium antarcticum]